MEHTIRWPFLLSSAATYWKKWSRVFYCCLFTLLLMLAILCSDDRSYSQTSRPTSPVDLSGTVRDSINPEILVNGTDVFTLWVGLGSGVEKQSDIYFRRSSDGGATFDGTINLSNNMGSSFNPKMAMSGKNVYVAWQDATGQTGNTTIMFRRSSDGGATFYPAVTINAYSGISRKPALFASENNVFLLRQELKPESQQIYYTRSTDFGRTFSFPVSLSKGTDIDAVNANINSGDNGKLVHIVLTEGNFNEGTSKIIYERSSDGGGTFGKPVVMSAGGKFATTPLIASEANNVYILWKEGAFNKGQVKFTSSSDSGTTFNKTLTLSMDENSDLNLFQGGPHVYTSWVTDSDHKQEIVLRTSDDYGTTFAKALILNSMMGNGSTPQIGADANSTYVYWQNSNGTSSDIVTRKSNSTANIFQEPQFISTDHRSANPKVSVFGGKSYVVWQSGLPGAHHVLFSTW